MSASTYEKEQGEEKQILCIYVVYIETKRKD